MAQPTDSSAETLPEASASARREPEVIVKRPPEGLAQGQYAAPVWFIAGLGSVVLLVGLTYLVVRLLMIRAKRA